MASCLNLFVCNSHHGRSILFFIFAVLWLNWDLANKDSGDGSPWSAVGPSAVTSMAGLAVVYLVVSVRTLVEVQKEESERTT